MMSAILLKIILGNIIKCEKTVEISEISEA